MAAYLWLDTEKDEAIYLGDPFRLRAAFADMAGTAGDDSVATSPELYGVPDACALQEDVDPGWLKKVRVQAAALLKEYRDKLSEDARWVLESLGTE